MIELKKSRGRRNRRIERVAVGIGNWDVNVGKRHSNSGDEGQV